MTVEGKLEKIKKALLGAKPGRSSCIFIDDVNMQMKCGGDKPPEPPPPNPPGPASAGHIVLAAAGGLLLLIGVIVIIQGTKKQRS